MAPVKSGTTIAEGTVLTNTYINPLDVAFANTRLAAFGRLYEKYIFRKLKFHFQPAVAASQNGQIIMAYDRDIGDETPSADFNGLRQYMAMAGTRSTQVWKPCTIDCPLTDTQDFYYTDYSGYGDMRLAYQGQFYAAIMSNVPASTNLGNLWVEYEVQLFDPQLQSPVKQGLARNTSTSTTKPAKVSEEAKAAWDNLVNYAPNNIKQTIKFVEAAANLAEHAHFDLPGGVYQVIQTMLQIPNAAAFFTDPTVQPKVTGSSVIIEEVEDLPGVTGGGAYCRHNITVPEGGALMWGNAVNNDEDQDLQALSVLIQRLDNQEGLSAFFS
jgi:hypothetical protein